MPDAEKYEILVLGSGEAGKYLAWTMAKGPPHRDGRAEMARRVVPQRRMPAEQEPDLFRQVASLARRGAEFGLEIHSLTVNMEAVQRRKRADGRRAPSDAPRRTTASGGELIMGEARFIAPQTVEVALTTAASGR